MRMEALVDVIHTATMLVVAVLTEHPSTRRAAVVNVVTAAAFVGADAVAAIRADRIMLGSLTGCAAHCRTLPGPVGEAKEAG